MVDMKCGLCRKTIKLRGKECEEVGSIYHATCFRCCICWALLSEYNANIRSNKLYCKRDALLKTKELQPFCKIYFLDMNTCYRVILASDKA